jgi:hypothetical protein
MHFAYQNKWHQLVSVSRLKVKKIKISYQIGGGGFRFREAVLMSTNLKFQIVRNMIMNNKFEYFGKIANSGTFAFFLEQEQLLLASIGWENTAEISLD